MEDNADLLDKIFAYENEADGQGRTMFPEHLSHEQLQNGIRSGKYMKGTFQVSRENYTEASVHVANGAAWFIQGRINCNRAVNGDIVAVELLPEEEWTCPQKIIRVRHNCF
ncbi:putative exosome complex exonuclease RRP44 [Toxocara canis]|uniref:Putative exosome complex exonuclease RRP44 n=1 Tax=Toxocara canis TaxID=6265 RepID=A0A0B2URS5_TOXCA|nr:putative exosome complex exonuclease RRP44 [Toxocara canis]